MTAALHSPPVAIIAEDEDLGRMLLSESAASANLTPLAFEDGEQALAAVLSHDVAIVLLDVDMPRMDGYTVCRRIREEERLAMVPVVMVTGHNDTNAINRAFEAGATDYISKPVPWALLPHRLAYILRNAASVRALADREAKVSALVQAIPDSLWVVSPTGELRWSRNGASQLRSPPPGFNVLWQLESRVPATRIHEVLRTIALTARDGMTRKLEFREEDRNSRVHSAELRFSQCQGGDVLIVRQDTSERTLAAARIERLAFFDSLTGLPNRQRCLELAQDLLKDAASSRDGVAFIYLDLNSFKRVNDLLGHSSGDTVLKNFAALLTGALASYAAQNTHLSLSRFGGDEFVILVQNEDARAMALRIAAECCSATREPIRCDQLEFFATPSIGIAVYPDDGRDVETLLKHADTAMYHSKAGGVATVSVYAAAMSARLRDWLELESRLRQAVREGRLSLCFQPKLRLRDNALMGVEALVRWLDPECGEIPPARFIPIAEETGLIIDIGTWLIGTVCRQLRSWLDRGIAVPIAVNISGKEILHGDPARVIETELRRCEVPASLIEVEITESVFVKDSNAGNRLMERLRQLGCRVALDDFGTGYSSLAYLTRFPPDRIKIDRSFISNVDQSSSDAAIVNAIMSLAQSLGLVVTAEGVERQGQLDWLRGRGCHEAQGYFLSQPLTAEVLEKQFLTGFELEDFGLEELQRGT